jgi:23S rRNA (uracil1939-C5)-methyltransferase
MDITIEKLIYGGEGLAHCDGQTVFVPFVLPGETVRARAMEQKKKFVRARVEEILAPSPQRANPPCRHFTRCGGCQYQHMPYSAQVEAKTQILRETLWRIGKIRWEKEIVVHASPPTGYRNRAQWKIREVNGCRSVGYVQAGSNAHCAVEECPVLSPRLLEVLRGLQQLCAGDAKWGALREAEAFVDATDEHVLLNADFAQWPEAPARLAEQLRAALPGMHSILLHETASQRFDLSGPGFVRTQAGGCAFQVGHLSFFQANRFLLDEFSQTVAGDARGTLALDLFAGVGFFTLPLARGFAQVAAVESNEAAARDLKANIEAAAAPARAICSDVSGVLAGWRERPDFVLLDPPRSGVDARALHALIALAPSRVHYVSCDPATLARDLAALTAGGFRIEEIHFFDMFPQTYHIESFVRLKR